MEQKIINALTSFNKLVKKRLKYHQYDFTAFGEDSIRYDFFHAIMKEFKKNHMRLF